MGLLACIVPAPEPWTAHPYNRVVERHGGEPAPCHDDGPADEQEYLWIAKEAYQADLPAGWDIYFDEDGKHFYYNNNNNTSTYEHPSIEFYRKLYQDFKEKDEEFRKRQEERELALGAVAEDDEQEKHAGVGSRPGTGESIGGWDMKVDTQGEEVTNKSRLLQTFSQDPTIASKLRKDIIEQDEKATAVLQLGLRKVPRLDSSTHPHISPRTPTCQPTITGRRGGSKKGSLDSTCPRIPQPLREYLPAHPP